MGLIEGIFGNNNKDKERILDSYEDVDSKTELAAINRRLDEINVISPENWNKDLAEEVEILERKARNLEDTISKKNTN